MRRTITHDWPDGEFWQLLAGFEHTAWRWESQRRYEITDEERSIGAWESGSPADPMADPYLAPWMHRVAELTAAGKQIGRVRVLEEPPTRYQNWELWLDRWNTESGEHIDYLRRSDLDRLDPTPFGPTDWWLFDDARLVLMYFDDAGRRVEVELITDPAKVELACRFRGAAIRLAHAVPQPLQRAA